MGHHPIAQNTKEVASNSGNTTLITIAITIIILIIIYLALKKRRN